MRKKYAIVGIAGIVAIGVIFSFLILWNSTSFLFSLAAGLDRPSKTYYAVMERIYYLASTKDLEKELMNSLDEKEDSSKMSLCLHVLGIIGADVPGGILVKKYSRYLSDPNNQALLAEIINCMGLLGKKEFVPFLEKLLNDYDRLNVQVTRYTILRSLFLITGEEYSFGSPYSSSSKLAVTEELQKARQIIIGTKGRRRTFEEMILLDKLYRPPGW